MIEVYDKFSYTIDGVERPIPLYALLYRELQVTPEHGRMEDMEGQIGNLRHLCARLLEALAEKGILTAQEVGKIALHTDYLRVVGK